jgi:hypothetical protein
MFGLESGKILCSLSVGRVIISDLYGVAPKTSHRPRPDG